MLFVVFEKKEERDCSIKNTQIKVKETDHPALEAQWHI